MEIWKSGPGLMGKAKSQDIVNSGNSATILSLKDDARGGKDHVTSHPSPAESSRPVEDGDHTTV